jgi:cytochrome b subunit of formate dehydrogenase
MAKSSRNYVRFSVARRLEHLVMLSSFFLLGMTGLSQKFSDSPIALFFLNLLGGIEGVRSIHHAAAIVMMLGTAWHLLVMGYQVFVLRSRMSMLPSLQDVKDGWTALSYNLGLSKSYPQMGRYTFEEKLEYWAFVWGTLIMGFTGFLMWNPITASRLLPGQVIPAAKAAHGGEAVLAVLAIIIWHMYGVHLKRFNKAMWTGVQTESEMLHEHPLELADLKAGHAGGKPDATTLRKRSMVYYLVAVIFSVIMLGAVYSFVNAEETAIRTLPPHERVDVFVPLTPTTLPTPLPTPTVELASTPSGSVITPSWDAQINPIFQQKCAGCHNPASLMGGLDMSRFSALMQGGQSGAVIIPGDSGNSLLVTKQQAGGHPGQLSPEELSIVLDWINAGAAEK